MLDNRTLPRNSSSAGEAQISREPYLFVVLECHRPSSGGLRVPLAEGEELIVGRGEERRLVRSPGSLRLELPDPQVSTRHARIANESGEGSRGAAKGDSFVIEDLGSTNGTLLHGERCSKSPLPDEAVLEIGQTLLCWREALVSPGGAPPLALGGGAVPAGLATLLPAQEAALGALCRLAPTLVPVLLLGESGTGKEVTARALHNLSGRSGAFVALNCGAIPAALLESQLFGHLKGAFSGALHDEPGLVRASSGGTLFLDEIGEMPASSQVALLRVLQEREVVPVGGTRPIPVDLRVVAATNRDPSRLGDSLRPDLYARLAGHVHRLPLLRERKEDLGLLVAELLRRLGARPELRFTTSFGRALLGHDWPLNIRELEQALQVAMALAGDAAIDLPHAPEALRQPRKPASKPHEATGPRPATTPVAVEDEALRAQLIAALQAHQGNITHVARELGRTRMQIHRWMRRFEIDPEQFRSK
jgi:sigma-54 dependent transcriptional regulator, acetoin dehydrogenase operon transcriptional activator AcoR